MTTTGRRRTLAAAVAASAVGLAAAVLSAAPPGGSQRWSRANHAGATVTLLEGPAFVIGAAAGAGAAGSVAACVAGLGAGTLGLLDDLVGATSAKGLRGHLTALARGELTTGVVKILGLAVTGVAASALTATAAADGRVAGEHDGPDLLDGPDGPDVLDLLDLLVGGAVVAGSANVVNLLDLRPGRALKATAAVSLPLLLAGSPTPPAVLGACAAALPGDLAGRSMLGDTGANAAGAMVGVALLETLDRRGRLVALAVLAALTLASENFSFTRVIAATPVLRRVDAWGRAADPPRGEVAG